jgi:hypothetical protein
MVVEEEVNEHLALLMLPPVTQGEIDLQCEFVRSTLPLGVQSQLANGSQGGADFLHWMRVLDILELWQGEKPFVTPEFRMRLKLTTDIHDDPKLRMTINALVMKGVKSHDIIQAIQAKFATPLREVHIDLYRRVFFDPRRLTRTDWRRYLKRVSDQEQKIYFLALTEPLDILKSELDLPAKVSVSSMLQGLLTRSYQKARIHLEDGGAGSAKEAREWISQVLAIADKYEKYRSADQSDFSQSLQLEFDFVETTFETPDSETLREVAEKAKSKTD